MNAQHRENTNTRDRLGVTTLLLDIGGVLLTNGWDHSARRRAAEKFDLDLDDLNDRHHLTFDSYERGQIGLDVYLRRIVFGRQRPFTPADFRQFMFSQSRPLEDGMLELVNDLKRRYGLRVLAVSNEGRELMDYRIRTFGLRDAMDAFIGSCYVGYRKPDVGIFQLALDIAQTPPQQAVYIDDREMFAEVASELGIFGIHHTSRKATARRLADLGLES
jgi:putative hydrolase of the HAD superfamily